jgi:hypothetical protein
MPEIRDRPPLRREGDNHPDVTYISVGMVLSQWEALEIQLGYIHAAIVGKPGEWESLLKYGEGSAFVGRLIILKRAAEKMFVKKPNQTLEANFSCFCNKVSGFAIRRHDVAHGIVRDHRWANWRIPSDPGDTSGFFLLPSHYKGSAYDETALPLYAYTSESMLALRDNLGRLEYEAIGMAQTMSRHVHT